MRFKIALWPIILSTLVLFIAFFLLYELISRTVSSWEETHLINVTESILVKIAENPEQLQFAPATLINTLRNDYTTYIELYSTSNSVITRSTNLQHTNLPCDPRDSHFIQRLKLNNGTYLRIYQDTIIINNVPMGYVVAGIPITQNMQYLAQFRIMFILVLLCTIILLGYVFYTLISADVVQTQKTFLSFASHELRTGLCAIAGEAELLQRKKQPIHEYTKGLAAIEKSAQELTKTMNLWLTIFRNQASPEKYTPLNIRDILQRALTDTQSRYPDRTYRTQIDNCIGYGHSEQLYEAFRNLLENAAKYSKAQSTIRLSATNYKNKIIVKIINGGSIPKSEQKKIFRPFYRSTSEKIQGFGIGLALVQMVIHQHQGKITLRCTPTTTNFIITLPKKD